MVRVRTIPQVVQLIKEQDPASAITEKTLRRAIKEGEIPYRKAGTRILLSYDVVSRYYGFCSEKTNEEGGEVTEQQ